MNILVRMLGIHIALIVLLLVGCAGWTKTDKTLLTINGVLMTIDMLQTADIYRHSEYYEVNPVIDAGVERFGTGFIPMYFAGSFGMRYVIADQLKSWRPWFLTGTAAVSAGLVIHNNSIGLEVGF
jgi:hypothetical protein